MLGHLRPYVGSLKRLIAWPYLKAGLSATQVGIFGVALSVLSVSTLRYGFQTTAFWLAVIAVLTDMADGEVARLRGHVTPLGNYYDAVLDRVREGVLLFGLIPYSSNLVALAILGSFLTSFAKARTSLVIITDNRDWKGVGDHADRAVMILLCYAFPQYISTTLSLLVGVTWSCFFFRMRQAEEMIKKARGEELLPYLRGDDRPDSDLYHR